MGRLARAGAEREIFSIVAREMTALRIESACLVLRRANAYELIRLDTHPPRGEPLLVTRWMDALLEGPDDIVVCDQCASLPSQTTLQIRLSAGQEQLGALLLGQPPAGLEPETIERASLVAAATASSLSRLRGEVEIAGLRAALDAQVHDRVRAEARLRSIVEGTGAEIGESFFRGLVQHLARALRARYAFVGAMAEDGAAIKTISVWRDGEHGEDFAYPVERDGGACADNVCYCEGTIAKLLPGREIQEALSVESCWGLPLNDSEERTSGVLVVMHDGPLEREDEIIPVMRIFAARAGSELERRRAERLHAREKDRAETTLASIGDGVVTTSRTGEVDYANRIARALCEWPEDAVVGLHIDEAVRVSDDSGAVLSSLVSESFQREGVTQIDHCLLMRPDSTSVPISLSIAPIRDGTGVATGGVVVLRDVSEVRGLIDRVTHQAMHDALTGLPNRRAFEGALAEALETARAGAQHSLLYLDLDQFKAVNDTAGHVAGDAMLCHVAEEIRALVRDSDVVARLGGDEFAILLRACPLETATEIAERMRQRLARQGFVWKGRGHQTTASIGAIEIGPGAGDTSEVMSTADSACYVAKERGRNCVHAHHVDDDAMAQHMGKVRWLQRLRDALREDRFELFYQLIAPVCATSDAPQRFEVLLRMRDRDGTLISPGAFIPAAERYHLMPEIDRWVIGATLDAMCAWHGAGLDRGERYSINLSGQSFADADLMGFLRGQLDRKCIDPRRLCFEITETTAIANMAQATRILGELRTLGCCFALDDFGSGLSSFAYLKHLPVDFIKIDGEFVRGVATDPVDLTLVESITRVGHSMGMEIVAEFVENQAILDVLRELGVDYAQGYAIERPHTIEPPPHGDPSPSGCASAQANEDLPPAEEELAPD